MHKSSSFNEKKKKKLTNNNTGDGEFQLQNQDTIVNKPSYGLSSLHHFFSTRSWKRSPHDDSGLNVLKISTTHQGRDALLCLYTHPASLAFNIR